MTRTVFVKSAGRAADTHLEMSPSGTIEGQRLAGEPGSVDSPQSGSETAARSESMDTTLARRYHLTRFVSAAVILSVSLVLVTAWSWWDGLFVSGVAIAAGLDAWMRWTGRWSQAVSVPLVVDSMAIGIATVFGQLPVEVVIPPFAYVVVSGFTLLSVRSALWFLAIPTSWLMVHLLLVESGAWSGTELVVVRAVALSTYLPGMVAILIAASVALQSADRLGEQLTASRRQFELAVTGAPLILFEYDAQGIFTLSEGAGLSKLGLVPGQVVGLSVTDVYAEAPQVLAGVKRSLAGESFSDVVQLGELFFQVSYSALYNVQGDLERVVGVATDVSERVAAEDALANLVRSKDQFVATIAHELRTPLTAVVGLAEELRSSHQLFSLAETGEFIGMIADQSHEVASIVEDLLVVARSDIGKVTVVAEEVDLHRVVEGVLTETDHLRTTTRSVFVNGGPTYAIADPQRVRQILRNLVTNAYRYGGKKVWIDMVADTKSARIIVSDNGSGIAESDREAIFEPFERAHDAPGLPGSLGLGLSVARKLAEVMNGTLDYRQADGHSQFELALPKGGNQRQHFTS